MSSTKTIERFLDRNKAIGILLLRIFIGSRLLYGVWDNIISWERMVEFAHFLESHNFPIPLWSAIASVYIQFIGALLILVGYKIRLASFILTINFIIALVFVHFRINDSIEGMTPALAMLFGCLTFIFTGAEKYAMEKSLNSKSDHH